MKQITLTATIPAFLPAHNRATLLIDAIREGDHAKAIDMLHFSLCDMDKGREPWARVGEAQITLVVESTDSIVAAQVQSLQAELDSARAAWLTRQREILDRIQSLQAIEFTPSMREIDEETSASARDIVAGRSQA